MFFFQDTIGVLVQLHNFSLWKLLFTYQAEHMIPLTQVLLYLQYHIFHLHFSYYMIVGIILHLLNCLVLLYVVRKLTGNKFLALVSLLIFTVNLTYTEAFLWLIQGLLLSSGFTLLAFYHWSEYVKDKKKYNYIYSILFLVLSSLTYGLGAGAGAVFALITFIYRYFLKAKIKFRVITGYLFLGIFSYGYGFFLDKSYILQASTKFSYTVKDLCLYMGFVIMGIGRGVVGRLFLPGFEPGHFQIIPTIISFLPVTIAGLVSIYYFKSKINIRYKVITVCTAVMIIYPYVWSGFVRYHFGLKQSLAERYAYPSLMFFIIYLIFIIKPFIRKLNHKKIILFGASLIFILQTVFFVRNSLIFEERPILTKKYFKEVEYLTKQNREIIDFFLPSYVNQYWLKISDIAPLIGITENIYYKPEEYCSGFVNIKSDDIKTVDFYINQLNDSQATGSMDKDTISKCLDRLKGNKEIK